MQSFPMVDIKVTLLDGAYHDVDSSEMAFKIAGSMAFKEGARRAGPALLEPVMAVEVTTPKTSWAMSFGDLNSRRSRSSRWMSATVLAVVSALVPLSGCSVRGTCAAVRRVVRATRCSSTATRGFQITSPKRSSRKRR